MLRLGVHLSISRGLRWVIRDIDRLDINTFQIFLRNPRGYRGRKFSPGEISLLKKFLKQRDIYPFIAHCGYVVNLCSPSKSVRKNSLQIVKEDLEVASTLGVDYYVIHFGSHPDKMTARELLSQGLRKIVDTFRGVEILMENTAGEGNKLGAKLEDLVWIIKRTQRIKICLDSAHLFSAGYDISKKETVDEIFQKINSHRETLKLIHLNDSWFPLGARKDRHQHIGKGYIGERGFKNFLAHPGVKNIPLILETPRRNERDDIRNINRVKYLAGQREV